MKVFVMEIFNTPMGEITGWQLFVLVLLSVAIVWLAKKVLKYAWIVIRAVFRTIGNIFSSKRRCSKVQCRHCGRTLDKCICAVNRKRGYMSRLYHYKKGE